MYLFNKKPTKITEELTNVGTPHLVYGSVHGPHVVVFGGKTLDGAVGLVAMFRDDANGARLDFNSAPRLDVALRRMERGLKAAFPVAAHELAAVLEEVPTTDALRAALAYEALEALETINVTPLAPQLPTDRVPPVLTPEEAQMLTDVIALEEIDVEKTRGHELLAWVREIAPSHPIQVPDRDGLLRVFEAPAERRDYALRLAQWLVCKLFRDLGEGFVRASAFPTLREYVEAVYASRGFAFPAQSLSVDFGHAGALYRVLARRATIHESYDLMLTDSRGAVPEWWPTFVKLTLEENETPYDGARRVAMEMVEIELATRARAKA